MDITSKRNVQGTDTQNLFRGQTLQVKGMYRGQTLQVRGMYRGQTALLAYKG